jgi:hypothetical protein
VVGPKAKVNIELRAYNPTLFSSFAAKAFLQSAFNLVLNLVLAKSRPGTGTGIIFKIKFS